MKVVTIIPAFNEELFIENVIKEASKHSDVIVIDDGSNDNTFKISSKYASKVIKHQNNNGKGAAIKSGLKMALDNNYDSIVLMDGDGQHNPCFIPLLASKLRNADLVIGSRFLEKENLNMPLQRRLSNKITTKLINYATGYHITDSQSGYRSFTYPAAQIFIDIPYNDYVFESEMFYQASKHNMIIEEQKISCEYNNEKSYISWINVLKYLVFVFRLLIINIFFNRGNYRFKSRSEGTFRED